MGKFRKKANRETPAISTASLPDVVFMLLFFFMVSTSMREVNLKVRVSLPEATEVTKLEKKSLVSFIYIGSPLSQYAGVYGTEPRIQLNDAFRSMTDVRDFVASEREKLNENDKPFFTVSLKIDAATRMGIVTDLKQELRKASALKINYASTRSDKLE